MQDKVIVVRQLSKSYRVGADLQLHSNLGDVLSNLPRRFFGGARNQDADMENRSSTSFWALRDVTFDVKAGEVVGVIGPNGAGKSTLLKIMSRVTEPSGGRVEMFGRVGSLLEVGTGFHPELTGRENVYLSGAILGMRKSEVDKNFDAIVEFSGVERFLDTPIKRYSSGMNVRLGFAVAAHLQSEIMLVDEVLAVGDAEFQRKCLGKMGDVARRGRTVIFVSHNLGAIQALCSRAIVISGGRVEAQGDTASAVENYLELLERRSSISADHGIARSGRGTVRIDSVEISAGKSGSLLATGNPAVVTVRTSSSVLALECKFTIYNSLGQALATFDSGERSLNEPSVTGGVRVVQCVINELMLLPGHYRMNVRIMGEGVVQDHLTSACSFDVTGGIVDGRSIASTPGRQANVYMRHQWSLG